MSSSFPSPQSAKPDAIWVKLVGPLLDAGDDAWFPNALGHLPRSAPTERAVVDHLYELERCGATVFVYDPILSDGGRMERAAQEYLYRHALNAWAVAADAPPPNVEVIDSWPPSTSTRASTPVTSPTTTCAPSSEKPESSS